MYRIELRPGEETVFRTIEELAIGIRNGLVTPKARIYHNASQKWLPVEFHPHYKKALKLPPTKSGEAPAIVAPPSSDLVFLHVEFPEPAVAVASPARVIPSPAVAVASPAVAAPAVVPPPVASPVIRLPTITYAKTYTRPEPEPAVEESPAPVAHASVARARISGPRPLFLATAAAVVVVGTYMAMSAASPLRKAAVEPAAVQDAAQPAPGEPTPPVQVAAAPPVDSTPAKVVAGAPSAAGPTFGGRPAPAPPKHPTTASIGSSPPAPVVSDSIEPPPTEVDLSIPSLPRGDSLAPTVITDSNAIRRILRVVSGKGAPTTPAQP